MRKFYILLVFALVFGQASSQTSRKFCGATEAIEEFLKNNPQYKKAYFEDQKNLREFTRDFIQNQKNNRSGSTYVISTVFHIIHENGTENISDAQVHDAVRVLNEDFNKLNSDTTDVVSAFAPIIGDGNIEFRLAQKDPQGNPTDGIDRIYNPTETNTGDDGSKLNPWPRSNYLNIWVVKSINSGAAGYAYQPMNWAPQVDGIVILHDYVGSIGTGNLTRARSLTHEVGHWLNLDHPWGGSNNPGEPNNCNTDDNIGDTPNTEGWTSCNLSGTTCGTLDNVQNFMDYSYCSRMYTQGQVQWMHAALNSSVGQRNNLWQESTLTSTGVNQLISTDFKADKNVVCEGGQIAFTDQSYYDQDSWTWNFSGGSPLSSTVRNVNVQYDTPGLYNVSLTVGQDSSSSLSTTKNSFVLVAPERGSLPPFMEDFENITSLPNNSWNILNNDLTYGWFFTSGVGYSGTNSCSMNAFESNEGKYYLNSSTIDISPLSSAELTMRLAGAREDNGSGFDYFRVYGSADCGNTWVELHSEPTVIYSNNLLLSTAYTPSNTNEWNLETVTIPDSMFVSNFMLKFEYEARGGGNNFYIDDINITGEIPSPFLISPADQAIVYTANPTIDWGASSSVKHHEYQIDENEYFNSGALIHDSIPFTSGSHNNTDTELQLSNLTVNKTYYWRVRAVNQDNSTTDWSNTWSFDVQEPAGTTKEIQNTNSFEIFPNPASSELTIRVNRENIAKTDVKVIDIIGKTVFQTTLSGTHTTLNCSGYPVGLYYIHITDSNGLHQVKKFIKK